MRQGERSSEAAGNYDRVATAAFMIGPAACTLAAPSEAERCARLRLLDPDPLPGRPALSPVETAAALGMGLTTFTESVARSCASCAGAGASSCRSPS
jgi:hypothetical protein